MKKKFCCEASKDFYEGYYSNQQSGHGVPIFVGRRHQRGHGLGSIFSSLFRKAVPLIRNLLPKAAKVAGKTLIKTGIKVGNDVLEGKKLRDSIKTHIKDSIKEQLPHAQQAIKDIVFPPTISPEDTHMQLELGQKGSGYGRYRQRKRKRISKSRTKKKRAKTVKKNSSSTRKKRKRTLHKHSDIFG